MGGLDYNLIGQLRVEKDRLQARLDRLVDAGDVLATWCSDGDAIRAWLEALQWDGAPVDKGARIHSRMTGPRQ